jgi:hypothetical protein
MCLPAVYEQLGTDIGRINQMFLRGQGLRDESLFDGVRTHRFMDRGRRRVHLRQQVGRGGLTRLADVHHITGPLRKPRHGFLYLYAECSRRCPESSPKAPLELRTAGGNHSAAYRTTHCFYCAWLLITTSC